MLHPLLAELIVEAWTGVDIRGHRHSAQQHIDHPLPLGLVRGTGHLEAPHSALVHEGVEVLDGADHGAGDLDAEVVEVEYDAAQVDFATLMSCFFEWHDPTQVNRQGPDIGTQYRTAIFPQNDEQRTQAQKKIDQLNQSDGHSKPIATTIETADKFWPAEDYHQHYFDKRGLGPCGI